MEIKHVEKPRKNVEFFHRRPKNVGIFLKYLISNITCSNVLFRNFARTMLLFSRDITNVTREQQHRASEISKQNIAASYMETRYLLRNKIFEENTHIFGPPMVFLSFETFRKELRHIL